MRIEAACCLHSKGCWPSLCISRCRTIERIVPGDIKRLLARERWIATLGFDLSRKFWREAIVGLGRYQCSSVLVSEQWQPKAIKNYAVILFELALFGQSICHVASFDMPLHHVE